MINEIETGYIVELSDEVLVAVVGSGDTNEEDGTDPVPKKVKKRKQQVASKPKVETSPAAEYEYPFIEEVVEA